MEKTWKVRETAKLIGVSDGMIRNRVKQLNINYVYDSKDKIKTQRITNDDVVKLYQFITKDWYRTRKDKIKERMLDGGVVFHDDKEIKEQPKEEPAKKSDNKSIDLTQSILDFKAEIEKDKNAIISSLNKDIEILKEQITKQDTIISELKKDKENLNQTITDLTRLLDQQQKLNLNQQQLIEHKTKTFWQRLFSR